MTAATAVKAKQKSYFQKDVIHRYMLDDGESFIEHKKLDEGLFQQYQDITSRIKVGRDGESTEVDMALGKQRKFLLENLILGWNLVGEDGEPMRYTPGKLAELPPEVISGLLQDIYAKNKILSGDDDEESKDKAAKT